MEMMQNRRVQAEQLHAQIMAAGRAVALGLVDLSQQLKRMRDEKLYTELGESSFDDYVQNEVGIKARQAYTYISTYEQLKPDLMSQYAGAGITKLSMLTEISEHERAEFAEKSDIANISVKELQKLIDEKNGLHEQLTMFAEKEKRTDERRQQAERLAEQLKKELEEALADPVEAKELLVKKVTETEEYIALENEIERLKKENKRAKEEKKDAEKVKSDMESSAEAANMQLQKREKEISDLKKALTELKKKKEEAAKEEIEKIREEAKKEAAKEEQTKYKSAIGGKDVAEFAVLMRQLQQTAARMKEIMSAAEPEQAEKMKKAFEAVKAAL